MPDSTNTQEFKVGDTIDFHYGTLENSDVAYVGSGVVVRCSETVPALYYCRIDHLHSVPSGGQLFRSGTHIWLYAKEMSGAT